MRVSPDGTVGSLLLALYVGTTLRHVGVASSFPQRRRRQLALELGPYAVSLEGHPLRLRPAAGCEGSELHARQPERRRLHRLRSRGRRRLLSAGGLIAKLWLERRQDGTYGAVYFWPDKDSMERFKASGLFEGNNSELQNVTSQDSGVLRNLTRQTQPELEVLS